MNVKIIFILIANIYNLLVESQFIENDIVTLKGEIAIFTNECHELILSELVFEGFLRIKLVMKFYYICHYLFKKKMIVIVI